MDGETQRAIDKLTEKVSALRTRIKHMIGRRGGHIQGQLNIDGRLQLQTQTATIEAPAAGNVRIEARESGGVLQLVVIFPSGATKVLEQE